MNLTLRQLAVRQVADYRKRTPGTLFSEAGCPMFSMEDAYAIQAEVAAIRVQEGEAIAGYKVGCTGAKVREQFGMDGPIRGFVFQSEIHRSGVNLSSSSYAQLAIEGEVALRLGEDSEIADVFPVIELHNHVFRSPVRTLQELIVNNGIHAGVVLPATESVGRPDDETLRGMLRVEVNGRSVDAGPLSDVPGGAAGSLRWLRRQLAACDLRLLPGQLVLTGTPFRLIPVQPGDAVRVIAENLGDVEALIVV